MGAARAETSSVEGRGSGRRREEVEQFDVAESPAYFLRRSRRAARSRASHERAVASSLSSPSETSLNSRSFRL